MVGEKKIGWLNKSVSCLILIVGCAITVYLSASLRLGNASKGIEFTLNNLKLGDFKFVVFIIVTISITNLLYKIFTNKKTKNIFIQKAQNKFDDFKINNERKYNSAKSVSNTKITTPMIFRIWFNEGLTLKFQIIALFWIFLSFILISLALKLTNAQLSVAFTPYVGVTSIGFLGLWVLLIILIFFKSTFKNNRVWWFALIDMIIASLGIYQILYLITP